MKRWKLYLLCCLMCLMAMGFSASAANGTDDLLPGYTLYEGKAKSTDPQLAPYTVYGLKDANGNVVIPADKYNTLTPFGDVLIVSIRPGGFVGPSYYGVIDYQGKVVVPLEYSRIDPIRAGSSQTSYLRIVKNGLIGLMDPATFQVMVQPQYVQLELLNDTRLKVSTSHIEEVDPDSEWFGYSYSDALWTMTDLQGNELLPMIYNQIWDLGDGYYAVTTGERSEQLEGRRVSYPGWCGVVDDLGREIISPQYSDIIRKYKDCFIVEQFTDEDYHNRSVLDQPDEGELWTRQGIIGMDGSVWVDFDDIYEIKVDEEKDIFRLGRWEGKSTVTSYIMGMPIYKNVYTYEDLPYSQASGASGEEGDQPDGSVHFIDVHPGDYFYEPVKWAVELSITAGTTPTTFSPHNTCTTAQILTYLWGAAGRPTPQVSNPFSDVNRLHYYYDPALWAYEQGLVSGEMLNGDAPCTRAATMTYLWKLAGSPAVGSTSFTDVPADAPYAQAVAWAVQNGITAGTGDEKFSPDEICTRGQIMTFLYLYFGRAD